MEWAQLVVAVLIGFGLGNVLERRHASKEAAKQRDHVSDEAKAERRFQP